MYCNLDYVHLLSLKVSITIYFNKPEKPQGRFCSGRMVRFWASFIVWPKWPLNPPLWRRCWRDKSLPYWPWWCKHIYLTSSIRNIVQVVSKRDVRVGFVPWVFSSKNDVFYNFRDTYCVLAFKLVYVKKALANVNAVVLVIFYECKPIDYFFERTLRTCICPQMVGLRGIMSNREIWVW